MIAGIWQGCTRPGMGKAYYGYLEQTGLKEYRETEGFKAPISRRRTKTATNRSTKKASVRTPGGATQPIG
jgi:hypothetical protein